MNGNIVNYSQCDSETQLSQILKLQEINAQQNIDQEELKSQGFVTARHDLQLLAEMNDDQPHIIATHNDEVVGYALSMTERFSDRLPVLKPMFEILNELSFKGKSLTDLRFFIMGQVCVAKAYRSKGVFVEIYNKMRDVYSAQYDCLITEIDELNPRSMAAHKKVGFELLHQYKSECGKNWNLVIWDWQ
jgi:hypothetical protein